MDQVWLNGRWISWRDVQAGVRGVSDFENKLIDFWLQWESGVADFVFYTSGSTGAPGAISFKREQLILSTRASARALHLAPHQRALLCLPMDFVAGKMMMVRALVNNLQLIAVEPSTRPLENIPDELLPHFAAFVPNQVDQLLHDPARSAQISTVIIGGAALPPTLRHKISELPNAWYATYGMTETLTHIALQRLNGPDRQSRFHCLPDIYVRLDDRECLVISTPLSATPVFTHDVACVYSPTEFEILGRWDNVINSGGVKVTPEMVEEKLAPLMEARLPGRSYFVAGIEHATLGQAVSLIVEGEPLPNEMMTELEQELRLRVPGLDRPRQIHFVPSFVRTPALKIKRGKTLKKVAR